MNPSEIDQIVNSLSNTSLLESSDEELESNMTENRNVPVNVPTPNLQLLKLYVDTIPYYGGDPNTLEIFITACKHMYSTYNIFHDIQLQNFLLRAVIGKLVDRAQILIGTRSELNSWPLIKNALRQSFGDQRNVECLEQDLITLQPSKGEQPLDFGKRIQIARSRLASKISSLPETEMPKETKIIYLKQYDQLSLKTFIRGLPHSLQSIVRLRSPENLEIAMNYVTEEENFKYTQNLPNLLTRPVSQNHKPVQMTYNSRPRPQMTNFRPTFNNNYAFARPAFPVQPNFNQANSFRNFRQPERFPSQPIDIRPNLNIKRHYPTNAQVFGPPKNVFKPTGQKPTNEPEPMSISTHIPSVRQSLRNKFLPSGPRNFVSQELYQIENEQISNAQNYSESFNDQNTNEYFVDESAQNAYDEEQSLEYSFPDDQETSNQNVNFSIPGPSNTST